MYLLLEGLRTKQVLFAACVVYCSLVVSTGMQGYSQQCSVRLENALEHMRRRSSHPKGGRSLSLTPYSVYQSIYGNSKEDDDESILQNKAYERQRQHPLTEADFDDDRYDRKPHSIPISRVEVEDMKVRLPQKAARWVEVDKCKFSTSNRTLDTRLIFPDLTISGKVVLHPTGGKCNMILRLRHAGIEFRTVPMSTGMDESRNSRPVASVRTDSHFAEPGFISVFAHGCQGPTGIKLRQNSKRRFSFANNAAPVSDAYTESNDQRRWGKLHTTYRPLYDPRVGKRYEHNSPFRRRNSRQATSDEYMDDSLFFEVDALHFNDDLNHIAPDARAFAEIFSDTMNMDRNSQKWHTDHNGNGNTNSEDINNALTQELEQLFSMGVKGLLTTYMQRALQPAIKETLMENMGYTLSYG